MSAVLITLGVLLVLDLVWIVWAYNKLVKARNQVREGWSGIEVQLKLRHDLVPALVECVKGFQTHERELLESIAGVRSEARAASGPGQARGAEATLGRDLGQIVALAEAYPEIKADMSFRELMAKLVKIEDQLQFSRRYYNGSVRDLNNAIESFPTNVVAKMFRFVRAEFFEVANASERLPPDLAAKLR